MGETCNRERARLRRTSLGKRKRGRTRRSQAARAGPRSIAISREASLSKARGLDWEA